MSSREPLLSRDEVARRLSISSHLLIRYEARGLIRSERDGEVEGYRPSEMRRVWSVVTLQRDLGINLAGVEAVLKLRAHLDEVHAHLRQLADRMRDALEGDDERDSQ